MKVFLRSGGGIRCVTPDDVELPGRFVSVASKEVPKDFLVTFALGKYSIARDGLTRNEEFRRAAVTDQALTLLPEKLRARLAAGKAGTKRASTSAVAKPASGTKKVRKKRGG